MALCHHKAAPIPFDPGVEFPFADEADRPTRYAEERYDPRVMALEQAPVKG